MIDRLYDLLGKIGYIHPLHPPFTHGPIGGVIVAFCFGLGMLLWRRQNFLQSGYYAVAIALVLLFPTVLAGIMDWQYYYSGAWIFPIQMKIALAALLFMLLSITFAARQESSSPQKRSMCFHGAQRSENAGFTKSRRVIGMM